MIFSVRSKINKGYTYGELNTPIKTGLLFCISKYYCIIILLYFYIIQHRNNILLKLKEYKYLNYNPELNILCLTE